MRVDRCKFWALLLALAMVPGAMEMTENAVHLLTAGHFAHGEANEGAHHHPGPEHSCTPTFHSCGCHASSILHVAAHPALPPLGLSGFHQVARAASVSSNFWPRIERPPQA